MADCIQRHEGVAASVQYRTLVDALEMSVVVCIVGAVLASRGSAAVAGFIGPGYSDPIHQGDRAVVTLQIVNASVAPHSGDRVAVTGIQYTPSCGAQASGDATCPRGREEQAIRVVGPAVGRAGTACAGQSFMLERLDEKTGEVAFIGDVTLNAPDSQAAVCLIDFLIEVVNLPARDAGVGPGLQTCAYARAVFTSLRDESAVDAFASSCFTILGRLGTDPTPTRASPTITPAGLSTATPTATSPDESPSSTATPVVKSPTPNRAPVVYVANDGSGTVSVIDGGASALSGRVPRGGAAIPAHSLAAAKRVSWRSPPLQILRGPSPFQFAATHRGLTWSPIETLQRAVELGGFPRAIAASPDGRRLYVTSQFPDVVSVIDTPTGQRIATVPVGLSPEAIAMSPDGQWAYVANFDAGTVTVIRTDVNEVAAEIAVDPFPNALAVSPDGQRLYVTHLSRHLDGAPAEGTVSVIDTVDRAVVDSVPLGRDSEVPVGVVVSYDGSRAIVTCFAQGLILVIDTGSNTVLFGGKADSFSLPTAVATDRNGRVYLSDFASDTVKIIEPELLESGNGGGGGAGAVRAVMGPISSVSVDTFPTALAVTPDGQRLYVGSFGLLLGCDDACPVENGTVSVIDVPGLAVMETIPVERFPVGIALAELPADTFSSPSGQAAGDPGPTPTLNCYTVDCIDPNDCLVPLGRHQPRIGGLRSGEGEHSCGGAGAKPTPTPRVLVCAGDCDGDEVVTISDIVRMINIALSTAPIEQCNAGDIDGNGQITIDEILRAVGHALGDCMGAAATTSVH